MKEKILKRKLKKEVSKFLKEQNTNTLKASENDPSTTCAGRGECCKNPETGNFEKAEFRLLRSKRVECRCPEGFRKVTCEY